MTRPERRRFQELSHPISRHQIDAALRRRLWPVSTAGLVREACELQDLHEEFDSADYDPSDCARRDMADRDLRLACERYRVRQTLQVRATLPPFPLPEVGAALARPECTGSQDACNCPACQATWGQRQA